MVFPKAKIHIFSRHLKDESATTIKEVSQSDLIIPAVPIRSMKEVLSNISKHIKKDSIVMEVCSVNLYPVRLMQEILPKDVSIISSHPLFGLSSFLNVQKDLSKLPMVIYPERIDEKLYRGIFDSFAEKLNVIEMSPDEHDKKSAQFQFLSHFLGGVLHKLELKRSAIDAQSGARMFDMMDVISRDSQELFEDMYIFNPYAKKELEKFDRVYQSMKDTLHS